MFLPSFSGRTDTCPDLLKYSLELNANVRLSAPVMFNDDAEALRRGLGAGRTAEEEIRGDGLPGFIERALEAPPWGETVPAPARRGVTDRVGSHAGARRRRERRVTGGERGRGACWDPPRQAAALHSLRLHADGPWACPRLCPWASDGALSFIMLNMSFITKDE